MRCLNDIVTSGGKDTKTKMEMEFETPIVQYLKAFTWKGKEAGSFGIYRIVFTGQQTKTKWSLGQSAALARACGPEKSVTKIRKKASGEWTEQ